jgi:hypothetical protein
MENHETFMSGRHWLLTFATEVLLALPGIAALVAMIAVYILNGSSLMAQSGGQSRPAKSAAVPKFEVASISPYRLKARLED